MVKFFNLFIPDFGHHSDEALGLKLLKCIEMTRRVNPCLFLG